MSNQKTYQLYVKGEYCTEGTLEVLEKALSQQAEFSKNEMGVELTQEDVQIKQVEEVNAFIEFNITPVIEMGIPTHMDEHFFTVNVTTGGGEEEEFTREEDVKEAVANLIADGTDIRNIQVSRKQNIDFEEIQTTVEASIELDDMASDLDLSELSKEELKERQKQLLRELNQIQAFMD